MRRTKTSFVPLLLLVSTAAIAQTSTPSPLAPYSVDPLTRPQLISPLTQPVLTPGMLQLLELEARFAQDVAKGGGAAFASWFADDAVTLNNGKPAVMGHRAIAATAVWDPKTYQLAWTAQGAQMGPSGDTGFTWGHYEAVGKDAHGEPVTSSGRYITFWKKVADGTKEGKWKVALDASANDAPAAGECCTIPKP